MFIEFAAAINELASVVGLSVIVVSVIYTAFRIATSLAKSKQKTAY